MDSKFLPVAVDALLVDKLPVSSIVALLIGAFRGLTELELLLDIFPQCVANLALKGALLELRLDFSGPGDGSLHTHELAKRHGLEISDLADLR